MEAGPHGRCENQLGNSRAALDLERLGAEIDENDVNLAAIIRVDRARRIQHRDAEVQR